jgi:protein-S-isoprenylcysteine O-methyltransferase Ste14
MKKNFRKEISKISVTTWYDPFMSIFVVIFGYTFLYKSNLSNVELVLSLVALVTLYQFGIEFLRRIYGNLYYFPENPDFLSIFKNTCIKYLGVLFGTSLLLFAYWLFPFYRESKMVEILTEAVPTFLILFLPFSFIFIFFTEYLLGNKKDGTYELGRFVLLQFEKIDWEVFRSGLLEWLVRLIFLTLNFTTCVKLVSSFRLGSPFVLQGNFASDVLFLNAVMFIIILITILPGYTFSSRLIGTEVKKVDTTWFAWVVTLVCYQPFIGSTWAGYFDYNPVPELYNGGEVWPVLTSQFSLYGVELLLVFVGIMILFSELIHLWSESTLGIRSSNLTNRGIITNGPFTYTKHPVYLSKCIGWFFATLPFVNSFNAIDSIRLGIIFLLVCLIYFLRSLAEEKLLATDENYVRYALFIDDNGLFSWAGRILPFLRFEFRYEYWKKNNLLKYE